MARTPAGHWVSPITLRDSLPVALTPEIKIRLFKERVLGWQLDIALECMKIEHGGFGALHIAFSYFELIGRYREGDTGRYDAGVWFDKGFNHFAAFQGYATKPHWTTVRARLWQGARNGLYHIGMTSKHVFIQGQQPSMLAYEPTLDRVIIDPEKLIGAMRDHFLDYIQILEAGSDLTLRSHFLNKFNHDILPQIR